MKICCVGRNYREHAAELKNEVPSEPVIFMKPATALLPAGAAMKIPWFTDDLHYECEVVLRIGRTVKNITAEEARTCIDGVTLGIDFTARDLQQQLKQKGLPWELAKAFDYSAVIGTWQPIATAGPWQFTLEKNGILVQAGDTRDCLFAYDTLIAYISRYITLEAGDLLFTGTPAGVGPVQVGDLNNSSILSGN